MRGDAPWAERWSVSRIEEVGAMSYGTGRRCNGRGLRGAEQGDAAGGRAGGRRDLRRAASRGPVPIALRQRWGRKPVRDASDKTGAGAVQIFPGDGGERGGRVFSSARRWPRHHFSDALKRADHCRWRAAAGGGLRIPAGCGQRRVDGGREIEVWFMQSGWMRTLERRLATHLNKNGRTDGRRKRQGSSW